MICEQHATIPGNVLAPALAHLVWDQGVGGSNPLAPTIIFNSLSRTPGISSTAV